MYVSIQRKFALYVYLYENVNKKVFQKSKKPNDSFFPSALLSFSCSFCLLLCLLLALQSLMPTFQNVFKLFFFLEIGFFVVVLPLVLSCLF